MIDRVADWLATTPPAPFFLYLHPMNVHGPYRVPAEHRGDLLARPPRPGFTYYDDTMKGIMLRRELQRRRDVSSAYLESLVEQYDTAIRYSTDRLAELLELLDRAGLYDDSLIIVTSDHGEELFEHGGFSHGYSLYDEVLHVPLYVKLPRQREPRTVTRPVMLQDLYPTILDVLGIEAEHRVDGKSLLRDLDGPPRATHGEQRALLYQTDWGERCKARAITRGDHKLIAIQTNYEGLRNAVQLYDVRRDPLETDNLADRHPQLARSLWEELNGALAELQRLSLAEPKNVLEEMDLERLRSLGYIEP